MSRSTKIAATTLGAAVLATAMLQCSATAATAAPAPATPTTAQVAAMDQPGVDLIEVDISGTIATFDASLNFGTLVNWAQTDPKSLADAAAGDSSALVDDLIAQVAANPGTYLTKGAESDQQLAGAFQGSGFTVTPDGYIVTNAHVAAPSDQELAADFLGAVGKDAVTAVTTSLATQFAEVGASLDDAQFQALAQVATTFVENTAVIADVQKSIHVGGGPVLSGNLGDTGKVARLVGAGKAYPGEDVAIIKVDAQNLPTVALGDDTALQTGDPVYAIGYPGDATFNASTSADVQAQSTVSSGTVNNRLQSSAANFQFVENTATVNHGSSGGPLLDADGKVVGITTAGDPSDSSDPGNGGKFFYAVPTSVVKKYLQQNNVHPSASPDQARYDQALTYMDGHHYKAALDELRTAQQDGYSTPYLAATIAKAQKNIGQDVPLPQPTDWTRYWIGGGGLLLLVLAGAGVVVVRRRRRGHAASGPVTANPTAPVVPTGGMPAGTAPLGGLAYTDLVNQPVAQWPAPAAPVAPVAPVASAPAAPAQPWWTTAEAAPAAPAGDRRPEWAVAPLAPVAPVAPMAPMGSVAPVAPAPSVPMAKGPSA